jgi:translation initiation factor IF-3
VLGVIDTSEALQRAREVGLDLVEVAPQEKPPVCRIMDYGKFKYQQKKRQHKGHTHHSKNKELRLRPKIGDHDLLTKVNRAKEFLDQKDKVVFSVIFRGRENAHVDAWPADRGDFRAEVTAGSPFSHSARSGMI